MSFVFTEITTFMRTQENLSTAIQHLNNWGCCARCILRFVGVKDANVFRMNDVASLRAWVTETSTLVNSGDICSQNTVVCSSVNGIVQNLELGLNAGVVSDSHKMDFETRNASSESSQSCVEETICTTCLGILQERYCCSEFMNDIAGAVSEQDFEYSNFLCSISVPVCLVLREYGTLLALRHLMPSVFTDILRDCITPVKDVWKWVNGPKLASVLKFPFDQRSPFEIVISFTYDYNDSECKFLYGLQPNIFRKRKKNQKQMQGVSEFNHASVSRAVNESSHEAFRCAYKCPPSRPSVEVTLCPVTCQHAAIYVAGRYRHLQFLPYISYFLSNLCIIELLVRAMLSFEIKFFVLN